MDQAERLRSLISKRRNIPAEERTETMRVISITSGKGGVGKTNFALNLAIYMARTGKRVVIVDADFGLANVEVLLGINPKYTFNDVLTGEVSVKDALSDGPEGLMFLSGGSGMIQLADISESQIDVLLNSFNQLEELTDILLIDTGAEISKSVTNLLRASHETIVVTTSDPTSITDAYAVIKAMSDDNPEPPQLKIVINRVDSQKEGREVYDRLRRVCDRFLNVKPISLGYIPYDKNLSRAVKSQEPVALMFPNSESSRSIESIGLKLLDVEEKKSTGITSFIGRLMGLMKN